MGLNDSKKGIRRLIYAAVNSFAGLKTVCKSEQAFRQELLLNAVLIPVALCIPVPVLFKAYLISSGFLVLIVELLNTGIEYIADVQFTEPHPVAKKIKDSGSAAVMLTLINLSIAWICVIIYLM